MKELEIKNEISDEDISEDDTEEDTCSMDEIERIFKKKICVSEEVVDPENYILQISNSREFSPNIAVALSNNTCHVYNLNEKLLASIACLKKHTETVIDCKFCEENSNLIYTGSNDGSIILWDLRTPKEPAVKFIDTTDDGLSKKVFTCFDIAPNRKLLCAGTNLSEGDAFILFWDVRKHSLLGGYWESHTDDITQVKFNPNDSNRLISGSTDGLINIYDLTQSNEDDALTECLNSNSSVETLSWFHDKQDEAISCITHTADVQLWKTDGAEPYKHIKRADIAEEIKKSTQDYIYVTGTFETEDSLLILAGSNSKKRSFRSLKYAQGKIMPADVFTDNKQIVRCCSYNKNTKLLFTAGEKGILNVWS